MAVFTSEEAIGEDVWVEVGAAIGDDAAIEIQVKGNPVWFQQQLSLPAATLTEGVVLLPVGHVGAPTPVYQFTKRDKLYMKASGPNAKALVFATA